jgi:hypothetical protein
MANRPAPPRKERKNHHTVTLDDTTVSQLEKLGQGNLSLGIRLAAAALKEPRARRPATSA